MSDQLIQLGKVRQGFSPTSVLGLKRPGFGVLSLVVVGDRGARREGVGVWGLYPTSILSLLKSSKQFHLKM